VWEGIPVPPFLPLVRLRQRAAGVGARWTNVQAADRTAVEGVDILVHHPRIADWERQEVRNDDSIVLELRWRDASIVMTGDIGIDTEAAITASFEPARLRVLKVPHHGSRTSSSEPFVRALAPRVAVFSVGRSNTFGHPAPPVLDTYRGAGVTILRTDRDGAVSVETDGNTMTVRAVRRPAFVIGAASIRRAHAAQ
jgi:competence protein ComEC